MLFIALNPTVLIITAATATDIMNHETGIPCHLPVPQRTAWHRRQRHQESCKVKSLYSGTAKHVFICSPDRLLLSLCRNILTLRLIARQKGNEYRKPDNNLNIPFQEKSDRGTIVAMGSIEPVVKRAKPIPLLLASSIID